MTASRHLLYGETSCMHFSGVLLVHSSTQSSNPEGFMGSYVFSIDFQLDAGQVVGLAILAALFLPLKLIEVVLGFVFGITVLLKH